jgi:dipeptidyl aminopeptidase/acylaminoacyl peptidase
VIIIFFVKSVSWATQPEIISKGRISYLTLSTDRQSILYFNEDNHKQGRFYSYSPKTKNIHISSKRNFSNISLVRWSPDKNKIAYYANQECWIYDFTSNKSYCLGKNIIPHDWTTNQKKILCSHESFFTTKTIKNYDLLVYDLGAGTHTPFGVSSRETWTKTAYFLGNSILYTYPRSDVGNVKAELIDAKSKAKQILDEGIYGPINTLSPDKSKIIFGGNNSASCTLPQLRIKDFISGKIFDLPINAKVNTTGWIAENEIIYFSKSIDSKDMIFGNYHLTSQSNQCTILNDIDIPFELVTNQDSREIFFTANYNSQSSTWNLYRIKI